MPARISACDEDTGLQCIALWIGMAHVQKILTLTPAFSFLFVVLPQLAGVDMRLGGCGLLGSVSLVALVDVGFLDTE